MCIKLQVDVHKVCKIRFMKNKNYILRFIIVFLILSLSYSCKKNDTPSGPVIIGQHYQGGIVAYILQPNDAGYDSTVQHGLIVAPSDISGTWQWYANSYRTTQAGATAIGSGKSNTALIIARQGAYGPAALCTALTLGGYTDWYLPSFDELNEVYLNRSLIGGISTNIYWSSSEYSTTQALALGLGDGTEWMCDKSALH